MSIRNAFISVIIGIAMMSINSLVFAQTENSQTQPKPAPTMEVEKTLIRIQPLLVTDVPLNEPASMDFGALSVPGISPELTRGVTVKAYTRYVEYEGQRIGQVVLTGVEKNGVRELLPANSFNAQFDLTEPRLEPGQDVLVEGDAASLKAALERLAEAETQEDEKPVEETVITQDDPGSQQQNSGGSEGNELAGSYQAPESVQMAAEGEEYINVTVAGCAVRIDIPQMQAYQQNRTETVKDGVVIDQSTCSDDMSNSFPLQKSYSVCTDNVDLTLKTATAQYVLFYNDSGGARQEVTSCAKDAEQVFPIIEKFDTCNVLLDYTNDLATPQSALIYQNINNVEVQVRG
ncbi:MAG: hypothetical protein HON65_06575, partial [Rhodospirillales bacterium]|nr:hypothetical protein [Rhodospirillales bacterium]